MKTLLSIVLSAVCFGSSALSQEVLSDHIFGTTYHRLYVKKVPARDRTCVVVAVEGGEGAGTDMSCFDGNPGISEPVLLLEKAISYHRTVIVVLDVDGKTCTVSAVDGGEGADAAVECF